MIAAVHRRNRVRRGKLSGGFARWTRGADRVANRALERAHPVLLRAGRAAGSGFDAAAFWVAARLRWLGRRLRPALAAMLRGFARLELWGRRAGAGSARGATAASRSVTPRRAGAAAIVVAGACLLAAQFVEYSAVEIGGPEYAGLPGIAEPPTVDGRATGEAHAYLLVPVALAAIALGLGCAQRERRRWGLAAAALGAIALAVALLVDLPSGLDVGAQDASFAEASAVLENGFYAELAAAGALVIAGLLYYARPCRIRISSSGRAASARRRRPRRRASSRARVARSA
jgi:hypothetical protein